MPPVSQSGFTPADTQQDLYQNGFTNSNTYTFEPGVCVLPVAEDPPTNPLELAAWSPVDVIRMHAPYRVRRVSFNAHKQNNPPVIPAPADTGAFIFVSGAVGIGTSLNQSFVNFDWTAAGEYVYIENCVSRPEDGLVLGTGPYQWLVTPANAQQYGIPPVVSLVGAVRTAGLPALVGKQMGDNINPANGTYGYGYNEPSFFPGTFFSADLANAGSPEINS